MIPSENHSLDYTNSCNEYPFLRRTFPLNHRQTFSRLGIGAIVFRCGVYFMHALHAYAEFSRFRHIRRIIYYCNVPLRYSSQNK